MCTHNAHGHGIGCQAIHTPYIYIYIYGASTHEEIEISPLTYLKEARFTRQLKSNLLRACPKSLGHPMKTC